METLTAQIDAIKYQLACSLSAIKIKDDALMEIAGSNAPHILVAMKALAIQPDDAALKAWLGEPVARTLKRIGEEQYQPKFGMVARTYAELPKGSYPDTWQELDELYSPKGLK